MNNSINVNSVIGFTSSNELYLDSRDVAEMMDVQHSELLKKMVKISTDLAKVNFHLGDYWVESTYKDKNNQDRKCYLLTKSG